jgi:5-oxopent-3-ene-1,2,5-tricarboxylate decarboxylase / 2-hydroxyhepta-2,4-diene-1,7-dioate isomerase
LRKARFIHDDNYYEGTVSVNGTLQDSKGNSYSSEKVTWLPPSSPSKIIGLALNYREHASELGMNVSEDPVLFLKPPSSLIGNNGQIILPSGAEYMHYEGELCVIMDKTPRKVRAESALKYVKGYSIANDVTVRDFIMNTFRPPVKAKGFDTFCPVGPHLVTPEEAGDISELRIRTSVNGEIRQNGNTRNLINSVPRLIEYISDFMTLIPGDMILTGTPEGISSIRPGDKVEIEIENLGKLSNTVVAENPQLKQLERENRMDANF